MRKSDVFQSKYLKAADIPEATFVPVTIREMIVQNLAMEGQPAESKPVLYFAGKEKGMVLNAGNWDIIEAAYGDSDDWAGKKVSLYITPTHTPAGAPCMGLRVSVPKPSAAPRTVAPKPAPAPVAAQPEYQGEPDAAPIGDSDIPF